MDELIVIRHRFIPVETDAKIECEENKYLIGELDTDRKFGLK